MEITVEELKDKMDGEDPPVLIDVREDYEHKEFNIGGTLIPLGSLVGRLAELEDHKEDQVVLYCRSGGRSGKAQQILASEGFTKALNLAGGMLAWQDKFGSDAGDPV